MTITVLTAAGTWADMFTGYPADTARGITSEWDEVQAEIFGQDGPRFRWQPINYPAVGFLNPDPNTSYNESVAMGVSEGLRLVGDLIGGWDRFPILYAASELDGVAFEQLAEVPIDLVGYSQGAEVVIRIAIAMAQRGLRPRRIVTFGSPCRPPGPTRIGNNPPGSGISRLYTPVPLRRITTDIVRNVGEMYGGAPDDTYLPEFYRLFVQAEVSIPFAAAAFQFLTPYIAGGLGAVVAGNPFAAINVVDLPKAINTAEILSDFMATQAHTSYHLPADEFGGRTGIQVAIDTLTAA